MKKILFGLTVLLLSLFGLYYFNVLPLLVDNDKEINISEDQIVNDSIVNPLGGLVTDNVEIYLYIADSDLSLLPDKMLKNKLLYTNNPLVIKELVSNFNFKYTHSDMATCESVLYIYSDKELIYKSNIVIESDIIGFQNESSGWLQAVNKDQIIESLHKLKPVYYPIVFL